MPRAAMQVLVIPFRLAADSEPQYALLRRSDAGYWQGIAGGAEEGETPEEAARREAYEEAGIASSANFYQLQTTTLLPVVDVCGFLWGDTLLLIPEYCFAVQLKDEVLTLSREHTEYAWFEYERAKQAVKWDSNRTALWELHHRLTHSLLRAPNKMNL